MAELKSSNLVYMEGSKALSQLDAYTPKFSENFKRKIPQHYKEWYNKAREGLLEDEQDLWTNIESVQIVRKFMSGAFSQREDLAIEKLIYELAKESKKIFKAQHDSVVKKLSLKTKTLQMRLVNANNTIARLTSLVANSSSPGSTNLL